MEYTKHEFNIFPEMQPEDYNRLLSDLKQNGYDSKQPIYIYESKIIDGWNRYKACLELSIEPVYKQFTGSNSDAILFIMRTNKRRNLTSTQWSCIAVEADEIWDVIQKQVEAEKAEKNRQAAIKQHSGSVNKFTHPPKIKQPERTTRRLAENFNTNHVYISDAKKIRAEKPEVFEQLKSGIKTHTEVKKQDKIDQRKAEWITTNETKATDINEVQAPQAIPYDSNIFTLSGEPSANRFGDKVFSLNDEKYYTATTIERFFHKETLKEFSLREYAFVQTFPNDFKFIGTNQQIKKQIGNAVAPQMGEFITKHLKGKTCGDLFAGCGGFTAGAHKNGIKSLWAIEWEEIAAMSYKMNFPEAKVFSTNIKSLNANDFEQVDIILGGPPCQGFSNAGSNNTGIRTFKSDPRNELYKDFLRFVQHLQPNEFIMENVKEIQDVATEIISDFEAIGYNVETKLIKGNDIGMKQNRVRFFFLGTKKQ